jgi:hypothetical protein
MSALLKAHLKTLRRLGRRSTAERKRFFATCKRGAVDCCCEIARNILNKNVPLTPRQLKAWRRHANSLYQLARIRTSVAKKRKILQSGGFLPLLLAPLLGIASSIIGGVATKAITNRMNG